MSLAVGWEGSDARGSIWTGAANFVGEDDEKSSSSAVVDERCLVVVAWSASSASPSSVATTTRTVSLRALSPDRARSLSFRRLDGMAFPTRVSSACLPPGGARRSFSTSVDHRPRGWRRARLPGSTRAPSPPRVSSDDGVLEVLAAAAASRRPDASSLDPDAPADVSVPRRAAVVRGVGVNLGVEASWTLAFDADRGMGFADEVTLLPSREDVAPGNPSSPPPPPSPPPLESRSGFDPATDRAWRVELGGGACRVDALDGEHRSTLVSWMRTGQWLNGDVARRRLNVKLLRVAPSLELLVREHTMASAAAPPPATVAEPERRRSKRPTRKKKRRGSAREKARDGSGGEHTRSAPPPPSAPPGRGALLAVAPRGARVGARVWLAESRVEGDEGGWVPHRVEMALPEGVETWVLGEWTRAACGFVLPRVAHQTLPAGDACWYETTETETIETDGNDDGDGSVDEETDGTETTTRPSPSSSVSAPRVSFAMPREGYPSDDPAWPPTAYLGDEDAACRATAARGDGGHVLVLPRLDGDATPGWFVLDTASPGYAIDPAAADALGASSFGRLSVVGVGAAALAGKLRRGSSVGLGACVVSYPTYMEQALRAALRTPPSPVRSTEEPIGLVGALGTDFLQHCVLEIRAPRRAPGSPTPPPFEVFARNPRTYVASPRVEASWQRVTWISGAPHVRAKVVVADDALVPGATPEAKPAPGDRDDKGGFDGRLFRLSLGAGGTGAIVSARAAAEWNMISRTVGLQPGGVLSGPGEDRSRLARVDPEVVTGRLARVEFRGATFETVRALTHVGGDPPDLGLSPHCDGALCADLFRGCTVVLDLGRNRIAVTQGE